MTEEKRATPVGRMSVPLSLFMDIIYLDNSATTPLCDEAKAAMLSAMDCYGNPSSLHQAGLSAAHIMEVARASVATALGLKGAPVPGMGVPGYIVFTAGGSEADALALFGTTRAKARRTANKIVTTDSEHSAVEAVMQQLEKEGWEVVRISTRGGVLDMAQLDAVLDERVFLVSMMMVNNETGALYDLKSAFSLAKQRNPQVITHTDAVQGFMKCKFTPASIGADLVSISGHKIHAPKGVGALYINPALIKAKAIVPVQLGGGQEAGLRSGTENVIGIAGFGAACATLSARLEDDLTYMRALRDKTVAGMQALGIAVKQPQGTCAPHIVNITLPAIKSETMLHFLSAKGVCVSAGSACAAHGKKTSRALAAFGVTPAESDSSLRVSLSPYTKESDIDALCDALGAGLKMLVRMRR